MLQPFRPLNEVPGQTRRHVPLPAHRLGLMAAFALGLMCLAAGAKTGDDPQRPFLLIGGLMMAAGAADPQRPLAAGLPLGDLYRRIVETEPECVKLLAADGRLLEINPAGLAMIEAESCGQVLGRYLWELVVPEHRPRYQDHLTRVFQGEIVETEFDIVGLRGTRRSVHTRAAPLRDASGRVVALLGISRDVSEIKRTQQALRASEERLRSLLETTHDWIWELDEHFRFTYTSPQVRTLLGYEPQELLGRTPLDLMPAEEGQRLRQQLLAQRAPQAPAQLVEHRLRHKEGRDVLLESSSVTYFDPAGNFGGWRGISRDVTERKRVEELLRRTEERERQRRLDLEHVARLSAMGALLAGIAHEVHQPLHAIRNYSAALLAEFDQPRPTHPEKWRQWAEQISTQVERAGTILKRLQAFSRRRELLTVQLDFGKLLDEVLALGQDEWRRFGVRLQTSVAPDLPPIRGDRLQLQQVLLNLVRNACEAAAQAPDGGRVDVSAALEGPTLVLRVADNGPGLPPVDPQQLFEPFFTTKSEGLGMGLAISRAIVEAHGGVLRALPSDAGALLECRLPILTEEGST
jgi:PAS domain S-box-containing protein